MNERKQELGMERMCDQYLFENSKCIKDNLKMSFIVIIYAV